MAHHRRSLLRIRVLNFTNMALFHILVWSATLPSLLCTPLVIDDGIYIKNSRSCTIQNISLWSSDFVSCFNTKLSHIELNLNSTIDRIMKVSEDCVTNSNMSCRLDYGDFQAMMNTVIHQVQDYSKSLRLEMDSQGKERTKDVDCLITNVPKQAYAECLQSMVTLYSSKNILIRRSVEFISCSSRLNQFCSISAKRSLDKMAITILKMNQREEERYFDSNETQTTPTLRPISSIPPTKSTSPPPPPLPPTPPPHHHDPSPPRPPPPPPPPTTTHHHHPPSPPPPTPPPPPPRSQPPPAPRRWYDSILQPIISGWKWITSFFG